MLFILFQLGPERYALEARQVAEVLHRVSVKVLPQAPAAVLGLFNYRGAPTPLIDLTEMALGHPAPQRMSTRILVVDCADTEGTPRRIGLLAEGVTSTLTRNAEDFSASGVNNPDAAWLGPVTMDAQGMVQWIQCNQLLTPALCQLLFPVALEPLDVC